MQKSKPENWEWTLGMGLESTPAPCSLGAPLHSSALAQAQTTETSSQQISQPPRSPTADTVHYGSSVLSRAQLRPCHSSNLQRPPLSVGYGPNDWDCILKPSLRRLYLLSGCTTPTSHTHTHTHTHSLSLSKCFPKYQDTFGPAFASGRGIAKLKSYLPCKIRRQNPFVTTAFPNEKCLYLYMPIYTEMFIIKPFKGCREITSAISSCSQGQVSKTVQTLTHRTQ